MEKETNDERDESVGRLLRDRLVGLVLLAGAAACAATLAGFAGRAWWAFDLASHFRAQCAIGLLLGCAALLAFRRRRWAAAFGVAAAFHVALLTPLYWPRTHDPEATPLGRVMITNVLTSNPRRDLVMDEIRSIAPDFLVALEVDDTWATTLSEAADWQASRIWPRTDNFGIAFFSMHPIDRSDVVTISRNGLPSIVAEITTPDGPLMIIATHPMPPMGAGPFARRNDQLRGLADLVRAQVDRGHRVIVAGDLNLTPYSPHFTALCREAGLRNLARGHGIQPTWPARLPGLFRIPIDHCLGGEGITATSFALGGDVGSDHRPLIVDLALVEEPAND